MGFFEQLLNIDLTELKLIEQDRQALLLKQQLNPHM